ncbi:expressed unknown protein [Seminavis robusta]|uniref:Uncharacterized protein n=1 Tax=Seminavis robusta TaxID=568900 RepID=A0A9N8DWX0_9STRA|nr:expressed unknown protein [Seminavis robusta]|eukprot:Sro437_g142900.1 n/a (503) ;mRNA; r:53998-55506
MADSVCAILGCSLEYAENLLAAAGGNVELAVSLGLDGGDGGGGDGGGFADVGAADGGGVADGDKKRKMDEFTAPYKGYEKIWAEVSPLPDSWKNQRLDAWTDTDGSSSTIVQPLNGPCGVLAVVQAELWLLEQQQDNKDRDACLTQAIHNILSRITSSSATDQDKMMIQMANGTQVSLDDASTQIRTATQLVEAAACTYGIAQIRSSLVEGPHWLCSADLLSLLLRGNIANTNISCFGAFDPVHKKKQPFYTSTNTSSTNNQIGLLSMMEIDEGIPVADDLKFQKTVWILHTGDHFVTMRQTSKTQNNDDNNTIHMEIYDGLQPNGPITKHYAITGDTSVADQAPAQHVETFRKKRVGQPDDIVQAKKHDHPHYQDWTYEVVPAVDDPDVQGTLDDDPNEPVYEFATLSLPSDNWRCATCYANRFKTMNFGTNTAGTTACEVCTTAIRDAMWSLWLPFSQLTPRMKRRARVMYAPKLEMVLSTLYPKADITVTGDGAALLKK